MRVIIRILTPLALLLAFLVPAGAATAAPADSERTETIFGTVNLCNGEQVTLEGTFHTVLKVQKDGSFIRHGNVHVQGVGNQGNEYVLNDNFTSRSTSGN